MDTSVSQVEKFEMCNRLWAFSGVYNEWPPQSGAAAEGDELHAHHENWFKKGIPYDDSPLGQLAKKALPFLPDRLLDDPVAEDVINVPYGTHLYKKNRIDLHWEGPAGCFVADYKKSKDEATMKRFGLKKHTLRADLAAALYGYYAMKRYGYDYAHLLWLYHLVEECEVVPVRATIDMSDAKAVLQHHNISIDRMENLKRTRLPILEISGANSGATPGEACEKYLGCHFAPKCGVTLRERKKKAA